MGERAGARRSGTRKLRARLEVRAGLAFVGVSAPLWRERTCKNSGRRRAPSGLPARGLAVRAAPRRAAPRRAARPPAPLTPAR
jgi:hypothetical protein